VYLKDILSQRSLYNYRHKDFLIYYVPYSKVSTNPNLEHLTPPLLLLYPTKSHLSVCGKISLSFIHKDKPYKNNLQKSSYHPKPNRVYALRNNKSKYKTIQIHFLLL
jgi:hypothetical protein